MPGFQQVLTGGLVECECTMVIWAGRKGKHDALWHPPDVVQPPARETSAGPGPGAGMAAG